MELFVDNVSHLFAIDLGVAVEPEVEHVVFNFAELLFDCVQLHLRKVLELGDAVCHLLLLLVHFFDLEHDQL